MLLGNRFLYEEENKVSNGNLPEKPKTISNKVIDFLVDDTLRRNGIDPESMKGS